MVATAAVQVLRLFICTLGWLLLLFLNFSSCSSCSLLLLSLALVSLQHSHCLLNLWWDKVRNPGSIQLLVSTLPLREFWSSSMWTSSALSISSSMPVILPARSGNMRWMRGKSLSPSICFCSCGGAAASIVAVKGSWRMNCWSNAFFLTKLFILVVSSLYLLQIKKGLPGPGQALPVVVEELLLEPPSVQASPVQGGG